LLHELGDIPIHRVLIDPPPGTATVDDVVRLADHGDCLAELVNGTLVEKPVGFKESVIAGIVLTLLNNIVRAGKLGVVSGEQGMIRMLMGNVRMPDVAFFRIQDLPDGKVPKEAAPRIAPALAIEVLSPSNSLREMQMKRVEYFDSGVQIVWMLDPDTESVRVYDSPEHFRELNRDEVLSTGDLLPGFSVRVGDLFQVG
jgi:Uma2 family endonuclease